MNYAIIVAAGKGERMQSRVNKLLLLLNHKPVIHHSIKPFEDSPLIDEIVLIANKEGIADINKVLSEANFKKISKVIEGGEKRQDSVYNGLKLIKNARPDDIILIHNGANPFASAKLIEQAVKTAKIYGACAAAFRAKDTIKEADEDNLVIRTVDRSRLWHMQTPQAAKYKIMIKAFVRAYNDGYYGTDDAELIERLGERVRIVECSRENFKITAPLDLEDARLLMGSDRVGIGQDSHKFTDEPKRLILGGVIIPNERGLEANSDGDVILHSLFNALSQSVGGKSIGFYSDELCKKGVKDSSVYLKTALDMVKENGFRINNIGIMIEAKRPRIDKYEGLIKERIASLCNIEHSQIGITATSGEDLTEFGRGNAIQAFTIVSLRKQDEA